MTVSLSSRDPAEAQGRVLAEIARLLSGLHYGSIEIVVHDGVVTQIERRERVRFQSVRSPGTSRI